MYFNVVDALQRLAARVEEAQEAIDRVPPGGCLEGHFTMRQGEVNEQGKEVDEREEGVFLQGLALERLQRHKGDTVAACRSYLRDIYPARVGTEQPWVNGDDATEYLDRIGCEDDRRLIGAVFRPRSGWEFVTTVPSRLKRRHGRRISCWKWAGG